MSLDFCDVLKQGFVRVKGKHLRMWKTKWLILRCASSRGPLRLEKYSDEKTALASSEDPPNCVALTDVHNIVRLTVDGRLAIQIFFESRVAQPTFVFSPENETELSSWLSLLCELCAMKSTPGGAASLACSDSVTNRFHVYLLPTPNLTAHGECVLKVATHDLQLLDSSHPDIELTRWPLCSLRRYGRDTTKFTIETGRSSPTGEGIFVFNSYQSEQIYQSVHRASLTIAETYRLHHSMQNAAPSTGPVTSQPFFPAASAPSAAEPRRSYPPYVNVPHTAGFVPTSTQVQHPDRRPLPPVPSQT
jgi:hypothetical protein